MDNFNLYAQCYDLLYQDKDYQREVDYVDELIQQQSPAANQILDLGCGTGVHAQLFLAKGYNVDGVDLSEEMIVRAKRNFGDEEDLHFEQGDLRSFRNGKQYPIVTSLFHVFSYQNSNEDLEKAFKTAHTHLSPGGILVFDFWYGPGVLTDPPVVREKTLGNDRIGVVRKAIPEMHVDRNVVDVNYHLQITELSSGKVEVVKEKHSMRYLFQPEIELFLSLAGFDMQGCYQWLSTDAPSLDTWNAVVVAKKKS
ncbi:MAG: class I SAM-dependent methyltransferase [Bacteroidota bacterium]